MQVSIANIRLFPLFVLFGLLILLAGPGRARAQDDSLDRLFTIQAVKVDETARSAADARKTALMKAEEMAYDKLLKKLTQPEGRARLPMLGQLELEGLISGIEVVDEQSSSRRYVATLNIRFEPSLVSGFFARNHVPHVLGTGGGILVLHAHARGLSRMLWEDDATVKAARDSVDWLNRIRQYVFPYGEMRERMTMSYSEVAAFDTAAAERMARMYGVQATLMVSSGFEATAMGGVLSYRFYSTDGEFSGAGVIDTAPDEAAAIAEMYDRVLDENDSAWREQLLVDTGTGGEMTVLIATTALEGLTKVESKLKGISLIQGYEIEAIGMPFSRLHLKYSGREEQLAMALKYAGLSLAPYGKDRLLELRTAGN